MSDKKYPLAPDDPAWQRAEQALETLASMPVSDERINVPLSDTTQYTVNVMTVERQLAAALDRIRTLEAQVAELQRRLDEQDAGK